MARKRNICSWTRWTLILIEVPDPEPSVNGGFARLLDVYLPCRAGRSHLQGQSITPISKHAQSKILSNNNFLETQRMVYVV